MVAPATTDPDTIRLDFISVLKGLTPHTHPYAKWTYCQNPEDVSAGGKLRRFHIMNEPAGPNVDGFHGSGMTFSYEMAVIVSYGDLKHAADDSLVSEDGLQIWVEFIKRQEHNDGTGDLPGFEWIEHFGSEREDGAEDDGFITGVHMFRVHYHAKSLAS